MSNLYTQLIKLLPSSPVMVGDVVAVDTDGTVTVVDSAGGRFNVRGDASVGDRVYFRAGAIEGPAPDLPVVEIEV